MRVLLISGSTRDGSSNTRALRVLHEMDTTDFTTDLYAGLLDLPAFVPGDGPYPAAVLDLQSELERSDAVVFSTPEYAGTLPGSLKNLLDWTVGTGHLYGKPVAWLDVAHPGRGHGARADLKLVLDYVGARIVTDACIHVSLDSPQQEVAQQLAAVQTALARSSR